MIHRHNGVYGSRTPKGRYVYKHKPIHSQSLMNKNKNLTYVQLRQKFGIHPYADDDGDGKLNKKDCKPWDKKRHGFFSYTEEDEMTEEEQIAKQQIESAGKEAVQSDPEDVEIITRGVKEDYGEGIDKAKYSRWRGFAE